MNYLIKPMKNGAFHFKKELSNEYDGVRFYVEKFSNEVFFSTHNWAIKENSL